MDVNDFMDLNTTELFDDSDDSNDDNREANNMGTIISDDDDDDDFRHSMNLDDEYNLMEDVGSFDAERITDMIIGTRPGNAPEVRLLNSMSVPTSVITPTLPSGLSIIPRSTNSQLTSDFTARRPVFSDSMPINTRPTTAISRPFAMNDAISDSMPINVRPATVTSRSFAMNEVNKNLGNLTSGLTANANKNLGNLTSGLTANANRNFGNLTSGLTTNANRNVGNLTSGLTANEPPLISIRPNLSQNVSSTMHKTGTLNSMPKYTKLHTALVSTMESTPSTSPTTKLVKIAPANTSIPATNSISDSKTSPVIIVPAQKMGQKFTSLKIVQKTPSPGSVVSKKILNLNEVRKLSSGGSLKPLLSDSRSGYIQKPPSLVVFKPPVTSTITSAQASTTLQLKPQQLYHTISSANPTKPATISFVTAPTPKPTTISIGTKLVPSKILTTVKPSTESTSTSVGQYPLPVGLTKIPKDTIVNKIATKEAHGIEFLRMLKAKQIEKSIEPTVTIGQKQILNKPAPEYQLLSNFLSSNDKQKSLLGMTKSADHPISTNLPSNRESNRKSTEKVEETSTGKDIESVTISNGKLSNPNGSIKLLKSNTDTDMDTMDVTEVAVDENCTEKSEKHLEKLNTSPRIMGRSKSLTIAKNQSKLRRRFPSSGQTLPTIIIDETNEDVPKQQWKRQKAAETVKTEDTIVEIDDTSEENSVSNVEAIEESLEKEPTKVLNESLECDEKIDDSDKSKSVSPDVALDVRQTHNPPSNPQPSTSADNKNEDLLTYIKWKNGTGFLRFSNLQFRKNEFNLLEVCDVKQPAKSQNNAKMRSKANCKEPEEIIDLVERRTDTDDKSITVGRKKLESKQRFKRSSMNLLQNVFVWELYLRLTDAPAAPDHLFINPFPSSPNSFEVGMKMEAIDPEHCSLFCVCTVVEKLGYRIRLTFDGYGDKFSFWRNADSMDIFPPGWCAKTGRQLQPPLKYGSEPFDWHRYILKTNGKFAPRSNFTHLNSKTSRNPFKIGMKLEADHLKLGPGKVGVATIADVLDNRILLQFDGFDSTHHYWADITSPNIHPYNWHKTNKCRIIVAKEYERNFSWHHYLAITMSQPVPKDFFCPRPPIDFREGMKLEIVDKKVPTLIRPCTVIQTTDYNIQVLFDGWPSTYSYWIDDDHPDIHPINWCLKTEHPLEPPLNFGPEEFRSTCGVLGCREVGNAKHFGVGFHYTIFECPYESRNWLSVDAKPDRLVEVNRTQKAKKRKTRPIGPSGTESYQKLKSEPPSSEENSLLNEWNIIPEKRIKNEEIEIGETKLQQTIMPSNKPENSPTKLPRHIQVTEPILRDYGPGLMYIHKLWTENSKPVNIRRIATNPICWTVDEVVDYVTRLPNCSKLGKLFREHEVDGDSFLKLCQNDLVDVLEIRLGPAVKIYNQIVALRSRVVEHFMDSD